MLDSEDKKRNEPTSQISKIQTLGTDISIVNIRADTYKMLLPKFQVISLLHSEYGPPKMGMSFILSIEYEAL